MGIAVVLSRSVKGLVKARNPDKSYEPVAKQYKGYSDKAEKLYELFDEKLNKGTI